jgi:hypothetical protein
MSQVNASTGMRLYRLPLKLIYPLASQRQPPPRLVWTPLALPNSARHPGLDQRLGRRPKTVPLDQNRRRHPRNTCRILPTNQRLTTLADPDPNGVTVRSDIGGWFDGISAEQLSSLVKQCAHLVQLLLQPGISHILKLPRPRYSHNSLQHVSGAPCRCWRIGSTAGSRK